MNLKVLEHLKLQLRRHTGTLRFTSIQHLMIHLYVENLKKGSNSQGKSERKLWFSVKSVKVGILLEVRERSTV